VHFPPIDAIRLVFAEEVGAARGTVSRIYDVGGVLYARASVPRREGDLTAGVALRVTDVEIEARGAVTWGAGECALTDSESGCLITLGARDAAGGVRAGLRDALQAGVFDRLVGERRAAAARVIEHPGNVVLSLITGLARAGEEPGLLPPLVKAIMERLEGMSPVTDWAAVEAVALVAATVTDETTRWHLDVLAGRLLLLRPSSGRGAWSG
jgi:hypothetical protein